LETVERGKLAEPRMTPPSTSGGFQPKSGSRLCHYGEPCTS